MVRFDSWRAVSPGNGADRNLATKSTHVPAPNLDSTCQLLIEPTAGRRKRLPYPRPPLRGESVGGSQRGVQRPPNLAGFERGAAVIGSSLFQRPQPGADFGQAADYDHGNTRMASLNAEQIRLGRKD